MRKNSENKQKKWSVSNKNNDDRWGVTSENARFPSWARLLLEGQKKSQACASGDDRIQFSKSYHVKVSHYTNTENAAVEFYANADPKHIIFLLQVLIIIKHKTK